MSEVSRVAYGNVTLRVSILDTELTFHTQYSALYERERDYKVSAKITHFKEHYKRSDEELF